MFSSDPLTLRDYYEFDFTFANYSNESRIIRRRVLRRLTSSFTTPHLSRMIASRSFFYSTQLDIASTKLASSPDLGGNATRIRRKTTFRRVERLSAFDNPESRLRDWSIDDTERSRAEVRAPIIRALREPGYQRFTVSVLAIKEAYAARKLPNDGRYQFA